jgi:hypothetical protein
MQEQGLVDFNAVTWLMVIYPQGVQKEVASTSSVEQKLTA